MRRERSLRDLSREGCSLKAPATTSAGQQGVLQTDQSPGHVIEDGCARAENLLSHDFGRMKRYQLGLRGNLYYGSFFTSITYLTHTNDNTVY